MAAAGMYRTWVFINADNGDDPSIPTIGWAGLGLAVCGAAMLIAALLVAYHWHEVVIGTAVVIGDDYSSSLFGNQHYLRIRGRNRAGQEIEEKIPVTPKAYKKHDVGSTYNTGRQ